LSTFGLQPTDLKVPCQTFQCYGRAAYFLGKSDAPAGTTQLVCEQCAQELKDQIFKEFIDSAAKEPVEELPFADHVEVDEVHPVDLHELKVADLKELAAREGIDVPSKATKAEIIHLLEEKDHE
jgi:hypothetical protein